MEAEMTLIEQLEKAEGPDDARQDAALRARGEG